MKTYYVRLKENKEPVGMFVVGDLSDLFDVLDEQMNPFRCEFTKMTVGGLFIGGSEYKSCYEYEDGEEPDQSDMYWEMGHCSPSERMNTYYVDDYQNKKRFLTFNQSHTSY